MTMTNEETQTQDPREQKIWGLFNDARCTDRSSYYPDAYTLDAANTLSLKAGHHVGCLNPSVEFPPRQGAVTINPKDANADAPKTWTDLLLEAWAQGHTLPTDSAARKLFPVVTGCDFYFPAAKAAVAAWSYANNQKHNPGQPLQWSQAKSSDHLDCEGRHTIDGGEATTDAKRLEEATAKAWRAWADLQMLAQSLGAPKPPSAT